MFVRRLSSLLLLSVPLVIVIASTSSRVHLLSARSQAQESKAPQTKLNIVDSWNAPVEIKNVRIGDREILSGASIEAVDWVKQLSIDAINKSGKTISYIGYAVDFTITGEKSLFRVRLQKRDFLPGP